jgi:hypothetical protein
VTSAGVRADGRLFTISTPEVNVSLEQNRLGEVPFTVTNVAGRALTAQAVPRALEGTPADWFTVKDEATRTFAPGSVQLITLRVEPPLGVQAGRYAFRLDVVGSEHPAEEVEEGPACSVEVPASEVHVTTPRGYLATLIGAAAGGILWLGMLLAILIIAKTRTATCGSLGECISELVGLFILVGLLVLVGLILMLVGAAIGIWLVLRMRRYLGAKLTAGFFAGLMIPWTILMGILLNALNFTGTAAAILSPVLFLIVPAVAARAIVLLIRTHHI